VPKAHEDLGNVWHGSASSEVLHWRQLAVERLGRAIEAERELARYVRLYGALKPTRGVK
jgi:hypothetical protein